MTAIAQMQIRFVPLEDRLLLRVRSQTAEELRFWLTRRYVRLAWPALRRRLQGAGHGATTPEARRAVAAFEHASAVQQADFATPWEEQPASLPLGEAPVLLARFALRGAPDDGVVLALHPQEGQGVDLALSRPLLHSFGRLLADAVTHADWQMDLALPAIDAATVGPAH